MSDNRPTVGGPLEKRRRVAETAATCGLVLICAALVAPFANPTNLELLKIFKWIFSAGALVYAAARVVNVSGSADSMRLKRLRRMEFWAGAAFIMAAAFWFYEERHLGPYAGVLAVMRNTILFTLVGAAIQIIASWLIVARIKKERGKK